MASWHWDVGGWGLTHQETARNTGVVSGMRKTSAGTLRLHAGRWPVWTFFTMRIRYLRYPVVGLASMRPFGVIIGSIGADVEGL